MTKLKAAVHLDIVTVKPYFTVKNFVLFGMVALFLTTMSGNISSGIGVGMMIATLFSGYPFALSEKNNLDSLYTTLAVERKTVVQGRYIFTLLLNLCAVLFSFILATVGLLIAKGFGFSLGANGEGYVVTVLILSALFLCVQSIQLPVYFKLGYTKARVLSIVPFAVLMAGYMAFMTLSNINTQLASFLGTLLGSGMVIPLLVAVVSVIVFGSYRLSVLFYRKREF